MGRIFLAALLISLSSFGATQEEIKSWYDFVSHIGNASTKDSLTAEERQSLYHTVARHKVAALSQIDKYDKQNIGFCFGRAMTARLAARKLELKPESIRKLFIIGDLRSGPQPEWRFHVTTLVKGEDGNFYAIDPVVGSVAQQERPFLMDDWIEKVRATWDKNRAAQLYLTDGDTVMPDMRVVSTHPSFDTGRINDLTFRADGLAGFEKIGLAFLMDIIAQDKYMLTSEIYDFKRLPMLVKRPTGETLLDLDYRGYFEELLADLKRPGPPELLPDSNALRVRSLLLPKAELRGFGAGL